jgi:hypothetical protein
MPDFTVEFNNQHAFFYEAMKINEGAIFQKDKKYCYETEKGKYTWITSEAIFKDILNGKKKEPIRMLTQKAYDKLIADRIIVLEKPTKPVSTVVANTGKVYGKFWDDMKKEKAVFEKEGVKVLVQQQGEGVQFAKPVVAQADAVGSPVSKLKF